MGYSDLSAFYTPCMFSIPVGVTRANLVVIKQER